MSWLLDSGDIVHAEPLSRAQAEALPLLCFVAAPLVLVGAVLVATFDAWLRSR